MNGPTLSLGQQANFHAAVLKALPRDINPDVARTWEKNGKALTQVLRQLLIFSGDHVIDCDAEPSNPWADSGWVVEQHLKDGQLNLNPWRIKLFRVSEQKGKGYLRGKALRQRLAELNIPVLNANVLDSLIADPDSIPEEWKKGRGEDDNLGVSVCFWGTLYRHEHELFVRYLYWENGQWHEDLMSLNEPFNCDYPAAVVAC